MKNTGLVRNLLSALLIASTAMSSVVAFAEDTEIKVLVDNVKVEFDVLPQIINERVMVPMRAIFDHIGANVEWEGETQTITATYDGIRLKTVLGEATMTVNGVDKTVDVPSQAIDGRVLVPVRFISEAFDCEVSWDNGSKTVFVTTKPYEEKILEGLDIQGLYKPPVFTDVIIAVPNCYPGTHIPVYTIVTGVEIKRQETLETGESVYVHELKDTGAVTAYWDRLLKEGWVMYMGDDKTTENINELVFIRGDEMVTTLMVYDKREVQIIFKREK